MDSLNFIFTQLTELIAAVNIDRVCMLYALFGITSGICAVLLLFRLDATWVKIGSLSGGSLALMAELTALNKFFEFSGQSELMLNAMVLFFISFLLALVIGAAMLINYLKKQETRYKIHGWEILLGHKKMIDDYYSLKKTEIESKINKDINQESLNIEKSEIEKEKSRLAKLSTQISTREQLILSREQLLQDEIKKEAHIETPLNHHHMIKGRFIEHLPKNVDALSNFCYYIRSFTDDFIKKINPSAPKKETIKTFLTGISYYIGQILFYSNSVRVHFRVLNLNTAHYDSIVATQSAQSAQSAGTEYKLKIKSMPSDRGLIHHAIQHKRSLVKHANLSLCECGNNDHIWKDFITIVFDRFRYNDRPFLTAGCSVKHEAEHREMLLLFSFLQIEQMIQDELEKLDAAIPLTTLLEEKSDAKNLVQN